MAIAIGQCIIQGLKNFILRTNMSGEREFVSCPLISKKYMDAVDGLRDKILLLFDKCCSY